MGELSAVYAMRVHNPLVDLVADRRAGSAELLGDVGFRPLFSQ